MKLAKIEHFDQLDPFNTQRRNNKSAFRQYQPEDKLFQRQLSTDMETYINRRKYQNSFTLSQITVSQQQQDAQKAHKETIVIMQRGKSQPVKSIARNLKVCHEIEICQHIQLTKQLKLNSGSFNISILPQKQESAEFKKLKPRIQQFDSLSSSNDCQGYLHSGSQSIEQAVKVERKNQPKKQVVNRKRVQKSQTNDDTNNRKHKQTGNKNNINKNANNQKTTKKQTYQIEQFPFQGVLRNCKCCGKLITKLCFKCPHLYCKAQNCPRKRKKILNQRMLQRMKQQRIEQHYRQRQLYQKMKLQKGQKFNQKVIKNQLKVKKSQNSLRKRNKSKDDASISYEQCEKSQQQFDSKNLYDSSQDDKVSIGQMKYYEAKNIEQSTKMSSNNMRYDVTKTKVNKNPYNDQQVKKKSQQNKYRNQTQKLTSESYLNKQGNLMDPLNQKSEQHSLILSLQQQDHNIQHHLNKLQKITKQYEKDERKNKIVTKRKKKLQLFFDDDEGY